VNEVNGMTRTLMASLTSSALKLTSCGFLGPRGKWWGVKITWA